MIHAAREAPRSPWQRKSFCCKSQTTSRAHTGDRVHTEDRAWEHPNLIFASDNRMDSFTSASEDTVGELLGFKHHTAPLVASATHTVARQPLGGTAQPEGKNGRPRETGEVVVVQWDAGAGMGYGGTQGGRGGGHRGRDGEGPVWAVRWERTRYGRQRRLGCCGPRPCAGHPGRPQRAGTGACQPRESRHGAVLSPGAGL